MINNWLSSGKLAAFFRGVASEFLFYFVFIACLSAFLNHPALAYSEEDGIEAMARTMVVPNSAAIALKSPFTTVAPKGMRLAEWRTMFDDFGIRGFKVISVLYSAFPISNDAIYIQTNEPGLPSLGWKRALRPSYTPYWSYPESTWLAVIRKPRLAPPDIVTPGNRSDAGKNPFLSPILKEYLNETNCFELVSLNESAFRVATPTLPSTSKELSFNVDEDVPNPNWTNAYERALEIWRKDIADHEFLIPEESLPDIKKIAESLARIRSIPGNGAEVNQTTKLEDMELTTAFGKKLLTAIRKALGVGE